MRMRWLVAGRWTVLLMICARASATFTGRPAARAPSAAISASLLMRSFAPNPPPMKGEITRTFSLGSCSVSLISRAVQAIIWVEVQSVSASPCHAAMVAWGSIIAWLWSGVPYVSSILTGAAAKAPSKSPTRWIGGAELPSPLSPRPLWGEVDLFAEIEPTLLPDVIDPDQLGCSARLLEGFGDHKRDRLVVVLDLRAGEQLADVVIVFAFPSVPAFSAVTMVITPAAALALVRSIEAIRPLAMAEPTT